MASASFRESMNSLGWSRREADAPVSTAAPSVMDRVSNLFGAGGYVRLPISESNPGAPLPAPTRREEEEGWFARKSETFAAYMLPAAARASAHARLCSTLCSVGFPQTQGEGELTCFHACCLHIAAGFSGSNLQCRTLLRL